MNIAELILRHAKTRPDAQAVIDGERAMNYGPMADLVLRTATQLLALGVVANDRVGLCLKDSLDHIVSLLAVTWLGAVAVPLDWRARPTEKSRMAVGAGVKLVLVEPDARPITNVATVPIDESWHTAIAGLQRQTQRQVDWHDAFIISASSGSTGNPKLTAMSHLQYYFAMAGMFEVIGLAGSHRYLSTLPLYYSNGRNSCIAHLLRGDCVILYPSLFDGDEYVEIARHCRATVGVMVPTMVRRLLASCSGSAPLLPGFSGLFCSGAPLFADEKHQAHLHLTANFHERYGTSETLVISVLRPSAISERADSVGQPHSLAEIEVVDDGGRPLPIGDAGRLRYRGPGLASPLPGAEGAFSEGWFYPGEVARLDDLNYIYLEGRTSEVIVRSGGVKVHPAEVEQVLCAHEDVVDAAVMGWPGAESDEAIVAFVVTRREVATGELVAHCRARLTAHKVPRQFAFLPQLPKNSAGKVDKLMLVEKLTRGQ